MTVIVNLNPKGYAQYFNVSAAQDGSVTIDVLSNADDDSVYGEYYYYYNGMYGLNRGLQLEDVTLAIDSDPSNGTASIGVDGSITYTPNPGFTGSDSFYYELIDASGQSSTAEIVVDVVAVLGVPSGGVVGADLTVDEDDAVYFYLWDSNPDLQHIGFVDVATPALNGDVYADSMMFGGQYTPNPNFNGTDSFALNVYDIEGTLLGTPVFNVTVNPVNDMPDYVSIQVNAGELQAGDEITIPLDFNDPDGDSVSPDASSLQTNGDGTVDVWTDANGQRFATFTAGANLESTSLSGMLDDGAGGISYFDVSFTSEADLYAYGAFDELPNGITETAPGPNDDPATYVPSFLNEGELITNGVRVRWDDLTNRIKIEVSGQDVTVTPYGDGDESNGMEITDATISVSSLTSSSKVNLTWHGEGGQLSLGTSGDINGAITAASVSMSAGGSVLATVSASGNISAHATDGDVTGTLTSTNGNINVNAGGSISGDVTTGGVLSYIRAGQDISGNITAGSIPRQGNHVSSSYEVYAGGDITGTITTTTGGIDSIHGKGSITGAIEATGSIGRVEAQGGIEGDITSIDGDIDRVASSVGDVTSTITVSGTLQSLSAADAIDADVVAGTIGSIGTSRTISGSYLAYNGDINYIAAIFSVDGDFTATGDIGSISASRDFSASVNAGESIGNVTVGREFTGSLLALNGTIGDIHVGPQYLPGSDYAHLMSGEIKGATIDGQMGIGDVTVVAPRGRRGDAGSINSAAAIVSALGAIGDVWADGRINASIDGAEGVGEVVSGGDLDGTVTSLNGNIERIIVAGNLDASITAHNGAISGVVDVVGDITAGDLTAKSIGGVLAGGAITRNITATEGGIGEVVAGGNIHGDIGATGGNIGNITSGTGVNGGGIAGDISASATPNGGGDIGAIRTNGIFPVNIKRVPGPTTRAIPPTDVGYLDGDISAEGTIESIVVVGDFDGDIEAGGFIGYAAENYVSLDVWVLGKVDNSASIFSDSGILNVAIWGELVESDGDLYVLDGSLINQDAVDAAAYIGLELNAAAALRLFIPVVNVIPAGIIVIDVLGGVNDGQVVADAFNQIVGLAATISAEDIGTRVNLDPGANGNGTKEVIVNAWKLTYEETGNAVHADITAAWNLLKEALDSEAGTVSIHLGNTFDQWTMNTLGWAEVPTGFQSTHNNGVSSRDPLPGQLPIGQTQLDGTPVRLLEDVKEITSNHAYIAYNLFQKKPIIILDSKDPTTTTDDVIGNFEITLWHEVVEHGAAEMKGIHTGHSMNMITGEAGVAYVIENIGRKAWNVTHQIQLLPR